MKRTTSRVLLVSLLATLIAGCHARKSDRLEAFEERIISVAEWGGTPVVADSVPEQSIQSITLHHGGEIFEQDKDFVTYLRNLQSWSRREKNWIDLPYHYLIDFEGRVYAGRDIRYAGDTNTNYDPAGHALICVPGNYEVQKVNDKQLQAIIDTMVWLCRKYDLAPGTIKGHKDVAEGTVCPGEDLYAYLQNGYIHDEVKRRLEQRVR